MRRTERPRRLRTACRYGARVAIAWMLFALTLTAASATRAAAQDPPEDEARADRDLNRAVATMDTALALIADGNLAGGIENLLRAAPLFESGAHPQGVFLCYFQAAFHCNSSGRQLEAYDLMQNALEWFPLYEEQARGTVHPNDADQLAAIEQEFAVYGAECHALLGEVLRKLGRLDESEHHYLRAIERNEFIESARLIVNQIDLGFVYNDMSRFSDALHRFAIASELAGKVEGESIDEFTGEIIDEAWADQQIRIARIGRAQVFENIGEIDRARSAYEELLAAGQLTPTEQEETLLSLGRVHLLHLGDPGRAMEYFERVPSIVGREPSREQQATLSLHLGYAWSDLGKPNSAHEEFEVAIQLCRELGDARNLLYGSVFLGRSLRELGRHDEAISWLEDAAKRAKTAGIQEGRWEALYELGRTRAASGNAAGGVRDFETALALIDDVRSVEVPTGNRIRFFGGRPQDVYNALVDSLLEAGNGSEPDAAAVARAYQIVQRARARSLLDRLGREPLDLEAIRGNLVSEREAIVEYVATEKGLRAFVVTATTARVLTLEDASGGEKSLGGRVDAARRACLGTASADEADALDALAQYLLHPVLDALPVPVDHLVIVPDGPLGSLPFAALPTKPGTPRPYLVESYSLSLAPSGSALAALGQRDEVDSPLLLAAFGDPVVPTAAADASAASSALAMLTARFDLAPLPATRREVEWVTERVQGDSLRFLGADATVDELRRIVDRQPRVLHLATHTVVDRRTPDASAVLLSASRDGGFDDGVLRVPEIATLSIPAELVTLSSCDSGEGEWVPGEGVLGLARAFLVAGSRSVLCTLWLVDDDASASFMQQVYHHLDRGFPRSEALRRAQLAFLRNDETASPRFWAPYVVLGNASLPVFEASRSPFPRPWFALGAGLVVATAVFVVFRLARGRRDAPRNA